MNQTHTSTTDPEERLFRKGKSKEAKLGFMEHVLMENRYGLIITLCLTEATGTAERDAAERLVGDFPGRHQFRWAVIKLMIVRIADSERWSSPRRTTMKCR